MSAAAPVSASDGAFAAFSKPSGGNGPMGVDGSGSGGEKRFAHIQDLLSLSQRGWDPRAPIPTLLQRAEEAYTQAVTLLHWRQPDLALVEFVRSSELALNVIPRHREYAHFALDHQERALRLGLLQKRLSSVTGRFESIKEIIIQNNQRNGTQPEQRRMSGHTRTESAPPSGRMLNGQQDIHRPKPPPSPKPERLHGHAIPHAASAAPLSVSTDALGERFAKLRTPATETLQRPDLRAANASSTHSSPVSTHSQPDWTAASLAQNDLTRTTSATTLSGRPQGPRGMPIRSFAPTVPAKLPLTTHDMPMPKEPEATYSPARNMQTTGLIAPPRHSARSLAGPSNRRSSVVPTAPSALPPQNGFVQHGSGPSKDRANESAASDMRRKRTTSGTPRETRLRADQLYDLLKRYSILLIDFRSREAFDEGHIFSRNIICIDPVSLREGMSADELMDSLVLAPDAEGDLFHNRDLYDLVVYYDADTPNEQFLTHARTEHQCKLKYLYEALHVYNQEKPLHNPPVLLIGGLEAWIDLQGKQGLATSNTLSKMKAAGQDLRRRPLATTPRTESQTGNLRTPRQRLRDYTPLDEEEERSWRERARAESVVFPQTPGLEPGDEDDQNGEAFNSGDATNSAIADFIERFPEAGNLERHAFAGVIPQRTPPEPPAKVPLYPAPLPPPPPPPPPPSSYATSQPLASESYSSQVPARPPPTAPRMSYTGVSDRAVSATTPVPRQPSTQLAPYIPPRYLAANLRLPRTGLANFGNTCYMNSTLQALSATSPLSIFFLDDAFKAQLQRDNWRTNSKGFLAELYANLLRSMYKGDVDFLRPTTFRKFCGRMNEVWKSDAEQQDAKEFLEFLLDGLHEDLNTAWHRTPLRALTEQEEARREALPPAVVARTEWDRYTHRDLSFVNTLFGGQHLSRLRCRTCGFTSTTYEAFTSVSVEIPTDVPRDASDKPRCPTLHDCLRSYCTEETLTHDDQWLCPRCRTTREASKRIALTRAPAYLVVHLKRFRAGPRPGAAARKIRAPVDFPLHGLDLAPYMLPPHVAPDVAGSAPPPPPADSAMTPPYLYDCYAVIKHLGATLQSGHYITAARVSRSTAAAAAGDVWRLFNDTRVSDFSPQPGQLQDEEAYILFYRRVPGLQQAGGQKI